jgi:hypothetical protein
MVFHRYEREERMIISLREAGTGYFLDAYREGRLPNAGTGEWVVFSEVPRLASRHLGPVSANTRKAVPGSKPIVD